MPSIITITFNPAIDKSTSVAALIPEKKLKCTEPVYEPGGGGINVARAIKKLGGEATAVYLAGGYTGKAFSELLIKESVQSIVIETAESTRENLVVAETASNQQYRFGMPGPHIQEHEWKDCLTAIEKINDVEYIVASGSLPKGVPTDIFARIAIIAKRKNAKLIVDTSGEALKQAVNEGVYLIKPNLGELSSLVGKEELNVELVDDVARTVIEKGKCEVVVVSMGPAGAMLVTKEMAQQIIPPAVIRKSTVGAGDSMVAGMVLSLSGNKSLLETVQYGVACGTAATMNPGTELCRLEDVEHLYRLIKKMMLNKIEID
ncbi:MAG: 1-phosphofructokinase family hexose kinase [Bacteroidota bacterium]|nr:1-phosphofructokinase family hexose kinase [Bacteroidota bacterium]